jgi:8-oxo-dGTP pyrophosphatase MutT (NUDIX family)
MKDEKPKDNSEFNKALDRYIRDMSIPEEAKGDLTAEQYAAKLQEEERIADQLAAERRAAMLEEERTHAHQQSIPPPPPLPAIPPSDYGLSHLKGAFPGLPKVMTGPRNIYVCGFLFDSQYDFVALVKKSKPDWQVGLLNGIGGKMEPMDRDTKETMEREFHEETQVIFTKWVPFLTLHVPEIEVQFFTGRADKRYRLVGLEDEPVGWYQTNPTFRPAAVPNLQWLIPMAMMKLQRPDWKEESILITQ